MISLSHYLKMLSRDVTILNITKIMTLKEYILGQNSEGQHQSGGNKIVANRTRRKQIRDGLILHYITKNANIVKEFYLVELNQAYLTPMIESVCLKCNNNSSYYTIGEEIKTVKPEIGTTVQVLSSTQVAPYLPKLQKESRICDWGCYSSDSDLSVSLFSSDNQQETCKYTDLKIGQLFKLPDIFAC